MNYYPHHIGDYRAATLHLTNEEDLAYRRLLEMYYDSEANIPLDTQWVSRRLRVGLSCVETVLRDFFKLNESGWSHSRCEYEIAEYNRKAEVARANGKKGGRRKASARATKNPVGTHSVPKANQIGTQSLANQEPITNNQEPTISEQGFALFWDSYPKKVGKPAAQKAWKAANVKSEEVPLILADIATRVQSRDWQKDDGQYIPNPATYLNQRRWEDAPVKASPVGILPGAI